MLIPCFCIRSSLMAASACLYICVSFGHSFMLTRWSRRLAEWQCLHILTAHSQLQFIHFGILLLCVCFLAPYELIVYSHWATRLKNFVCTCFRSEGGFPCYCRRVMCACICYRRRLEKFIVIVQKTIIHCKFWAKIATPNSCSQTP